MILTLVLILVALVLTLWIGSMYLLWKQSTGTTYAPLHHAPVEEVYEKGARLGRRGLYQALRSLKQAIGFGLSKASALLYRIFPAARSAFTKRDELTGLKKGPSSYFLHSLSEKEPEKTHTTPRRNKKVV